MIAERIQRSGFHQARHQTLTVLFIEERDAEAMVARLVELGVEPRATSLLRVVLGETPKRAHLSAPPSALLSSHYSTRGILVGCLLALVLGLGLYSTNFLQLSFLEALLIHTLALVILGGVIGGAIGAILASIQAQKNAAALLPQSTDGFLVIVKMPPHLLVQGEALAQELGAKKVLS